MKRRQKNTVFILAIMVLFIGSSIVPAFHIDLKERVEDVIQSKCDFFINKQINNIEPPMSPWSYEDVHNPNLGYDLEMMNDYDDYRDRLYGRYSDYHRDYLMNTSHYPYDEDYFDYHEEMMKRYENHSLNYNQDVSPSERPDFENGTIWYVDDVPGEGPDNPPENFTKIQDAINASTDGDTVYVYSGFYLENLVVNKSIILQGGGKNNTIIDGSENDHIVIVSKDADELSISKFTLQSKGKQFTGLYLYSDSTIVKDIKINNCNIGIALRDISGNIVKNCEFSNNNYGIWAWMCENTTIINNDIKNNVLDGMALQWCSYLNITENMISNNVYNGILEISCSKLELYDNIINENEEFGFQSFSSNENSINKNKFKQNGRDGISFYKSSKNNVMNNNFTNNIGSGVKLVFQSIDNLISCNDFINDGISVDITTINNKIENNTVNGKKLIFLVNQSNINIEKAGQIILINCKNIQIINQTISNTENGIMLWNSENCNISNNNIYSNEFIGIYLYSSSSNNIVVGNNVTTNDYGIFLDESNNCTIEDNICRNNNVDGIGLLDSSQNSIRNNTCIDNMKGIASRNRNLGSSRNLFVDNTCIGNIHGLLMNNASFSNKIQLNNFTLNGIGLYIHNSSYNDIVQNFFNHNNWEGIAMRENSNNNIISHNQIGPMHWRGLWIEKSNNNQIHHNKITENNGIGIVLMETQHNKINHNNIMGNNFYGLQGIFCFDNARYNYWGANRPDMIIDNPDNTADAVQTLWTPVFPCLKEPVDIRK